MMVEWVLSVMLLQLRVLTLWQRLIPRELLHHHPQEWKGWHRHQEQNPMADPMAGLDAALGGAMDQATDQGAGAGAPDMGVPPDAGVDSPIMDDPGAGEPEPDMPPPDDPII